MRQPHRHHATINAAFNQGFAIAPILYLLGLIGVGAGVLFSGYSQILRSNQTMANIMSSKNDLQGTATTLAASSWLSTDQTLLCPPLIGSHSPSTPSVKCSSASGAITVGTSFANAVAANLPANYASVSSAGSPVEVGVFAAGSGAKVLDPWGHYYIYCRWENVIGTASAIMVISGGPNGKIESTCGSTTAGGDDLFVVWTTAVTQNHAAVWQTTSSGTAVTGTQFGATGSQIYIDTAGDVTIPGILAVTGATTLGTAGLTVNGPTSFTDGATGTTGTFSGEISGGSLNITGSSTLNSLSAGTSTLSSLTVTNNATVGGTLGVTGNTTLTGSLTAGSSTLSGLSVTGTSFLGGNVDTSTGVVQIGTTVAASGTSSPLLTVGKVVSTVYPFTVDQYGAVTGSTFTGTTFNGSLNGSQSGGSVSATTLAASGATTLSGPLGVSGITTLGAQLNGTSAVFSGNVQAASFTGAMTIGGGGVTLSGVIPIANGGTGQTSASAALAALGVTSGGFLNTALLTSGLIPGADIVSGSVTSTQLNATGVTAGTYTSVTVTADGRITAASNGANNNLTDGSGDSITVGTTGGIVFDVGSSVVGNWTTPGLMVGSSKAALDKLDVYGSTAIGTGYAGVTAAPTNGLIVQGNVGIGTTNPLGNALDVNGTVAATLFNGSGAGLTGIGTSGITGTWSPGQGGTGTNTVFTQGSVVFAGASGVYSQDNANFFWDDANHRLGIGTSVPMQKLHVMGSIQLDSGQGNDNNISTPSGEDLVLYAGTNGQAAYGTCPTTYSVHGGGYVQVNYGCAGTYQYDNYGSWWHMGYSGMIFSNSGGNGSTYPMEFSSAPGFYFTGGSVGIGTTVPEGTLDVETSTNNGSTILKLGNEGGAGFEFSRNGTNGYLSIQGDQTGYNDILVAPTSGGVGIGTNNPLSYELFVNGNTNVNGTLTATNFVGNGSGLTGVTVSASSITGVVPIANGGTDASSQTTNGVNYFNGTSITSGTGFVYTGGDVGIGLTSPLQLLHLSLSQSGTSEPKGQNGGATGDTHTLAYFDGSSGSIGSKVGFQFGGLGGYSTGGIFSVLTSNANNTTGDITFDLRNPSNATSLSEMMRVTSGGSVGIGTTSPDSMDGFGAANKLTVAGGLDGGISGGSFNIGASPYSNGNLALYGTGASSVILFATGSTPTEHVRIDQNGNVGIGTASPQSKLHIQAGEVQTGTSGNACAAANAGAIRYASGSLYYCDNASTWETLDSSGSGNNGDWEEVTQAAPNPTGTSQGYFGANATYGAMLSGDGSVSDVTLFDHSGGPALEIPSGTINLYAVGNVGIGTASPGQALEVNGNISAKNGYALYYASGVLSGYVGPGADLFTSGPTASADLGIRSATGNLGFAANSTTPQMILTSSGNVGIGPVTPLTTLHITGNEGMYSSGASSSGSPVAASLYLGDSNFASSGFYNSAPGMSAVYDPGSAVGGALAFYYYGGVSNARSEAMRITYPGKVGIGTTAPDATLDVERANDSGNILQIGSLGANYFAFARNAGTGALSIQGNQLGYNNIVLAPTGGNVGIGTTAPPTNLTIGAVAPAESFYASGGAPDQKYWDFYDGGGAQAFRAVNDAYSAATTWMQVNRGSGYTISNVVFPNSSVGIGTTAPGVAGLDVWGNIRAGAATSSWAQLSSPTIAADTSIYSYGYICAGEGSGNCTAAGGSGVVLASTGSNVYGSVYLTGIGNTYFNGGNVGIGTTSPALLLDVQSSASTVPLIRSYGSTFSGMRLDTSSANASARNWGVVSNYSVFGDFGIVQSNALGGDFTSAGTTRLYISNAGNVGIGTATPATTLHVYSSGDPLRLSSSASGPNWITGYDELSTPNELFDFSRNGNSLQIATYSNGHILLMPGSLNSGTAANVGIGTTSPQSKLHVQGGEVQVGSSGVSCAAANAGAIRYASGTLYFCDNASTWETLDSSGGGNAGDWEEVTQAAPNPTGTSQGYFGASATLGAILSGDGSTADVTIENHGGSPALEVLTGSTNIYMPGNVGIGTATPVVGLDAYASDLRLNNFVTQSMTRTLSLTVNNTVNIGSYTIYAGAAAFNIDVTVPSGGYSVAKHYILPVQYNQDSAAWETVMPIGNTGSYGGNDFALEAQNNGGVLSLRLRTTGTDGSSVGTAYIQIREEGNNTSTFAASSATGSSSAPTAFFSSTALTQTGYNVGIGTTGPLSPLYIIAPGAPAASGNMNTGFVISGGYGGGALNMGFSNTNAYSWIDSGYNNNANTALPLALQANGGAVGIGTTAPTSPLVVYGSAGSYGTAMQIVGQGTVNQVNITPAVNTWGLLLGSDPSSEGVSGYHGPQYGYLINVANEPLMLGADNAVNMTILPSGSVGIGTASPQSKLHIQAGEVQTGTSGNACAAANAGAIRYASGTLYYCDNASTWETLDSSGSGNSGDWEEVTQAAPAPTGTSQGYFGASATLGAILSGDGSTSDATLENKSGTPALEVPTGTTNLYAPGNVGIGSSAPGETLDVTGTIRGSGDIISSGVGSDGASIRMIDGNYGAFFRNDGTNLYLLLTASGSQYGSWNSLRPFYVNDSTGAVTIDASAAGTTIGGNISLSLSNPSITTSGSYITIPYGVYASGGTSYFQTNTEFRGGISDDTAAYLTINGGTSGYTYVNGSVGIGTAAPRTALDTWTGTMSGAENDYKQAQFAMSGGGTVTWGGSGSYLKWSARFIALPVGQVTASNGYIEIDEPTSGTIPAGQVYSGVARSWSGSGIVLNNWEALYAVHTPGGGATAISYYIVTYTSAFSAPSNWVLVAAVNADDGSAKLGDGVTLAAGGTWSASGANGPYVNLQSATPGTQQTGNMNIFGTGIFGGNVGIGTTAPQAKLDIASTVWSGVNFTNGSNIGYIFNDGNFHIESTAGSPLWINGDHSAVTHIDYAGGNTLINETSGNVGIGTTAPNAVTDVERANDSGNILQIGSLGANYFDFARNAGTGALSIQGNQSGYNNIVLAPTSGNVGIGTTSPRSTLDVNGAISLPTSNEAGSSSANWLGTGGIGAAFYGSSAIELGIANATKMVINSSGNVGIGTTNPAATLDVTGGIRVNNSNFPLLRITNTGSATDQHSAEWIDLSGVFAGRFVNDAYTSESDWMRVYRNSGTYTTQYVTFPAGNVGIGTTSPGALFTVGSNTFEVTSTGATTGYSFALNSGAGSGAGLFGGSGDGATFATYDARVNSWWGLGFGSSCGTASGCPDNTNSTIVMDTRYGNLYTAGSVGIGTAVAGAALAVNGGLTVGTYGGNGTTASSGEIAASGPIYSGTTGGDWGTTWQMEARKDQNATTYLGVNNATSGSAAANELYMVGGTANSYYGMELADNAGSPYISNYAGPGVLNAYWQFPNYAFKNAAGSSTWMVINSSGNVGVNTTSPSTKLEIDNNQAPENSNATPLGGFSVKSTASTALVEGVDPSSPYEGWIQVRHGTLAGYTYPLSLQPMGGSVGIGTTNPLGYTLDVYGTANVTGNLSVTGTFSPSSITTSSLTVNGASTLNGAVVQAAGDYIYPGCDGATGCVASQTSYYLFTDFPNAAVYTNSNFVAEGNIYLGTEGIWLASWLNQSVASGSSPNFYNPYIGYIGANLNSWLNQSVATTASPTYAGLNIGSASNAVISLQQTSSTTNLKDSILMGGSESNGWSTVNGAGMDLVVNYAVDSNARLNFWSYPQTTSAPSMTLMNGSLGIGTTAPGATLDVERANDSGNILQLGSSGADYFDFARSASTGALSIQGNQTGYNNIVLAPTSGNVGIGTTAPGHQLEVYGTSPFFQIQGSVQPTFQIYNNAAGTDSKTSEIYDESGTIVFRTVNDAYSQSAAYMQVARNSSAYTINSVTFPSGKVGIGTTAPTSNLTVINSTGGGYNGPTSGTWATSIINASNGSGQNGLSVSNAWAGAGSTIFEVAEGWNSSAVGYYPVFSIDGIGDISWKNTAGTTLAYFQNGTGNVGIGATSPQAKLNILSADSSSTADLMFTYDSAGDYRNGIANTFNGGVLSGNSMSFLVSNDSTSTNVNVMTLNGAGYVGIGQPSPHGPLDISTNLNGTINAANGVSDGIVFWQAVDNSSNIQSYIDGQWTARTTYASGCCNLLNIDTDVGTVDIGNTVDGAQVNILTNLSVTDNIYWGTEGIWLNSWLNQQQF